MAYTLTKNPSGVLKSVNEWNAHNIRGVPFTEQMQSKINHCYGKARSKIMAINSNDFWKNKCLLTMDRIVTSGVTSVNQ